MYKQVEQLKYRPFKQVHIIILGVTLLLSFAVVIWIGIPEVSNDKRVPLSSSYITLLLSSPLLLASGLWFMLSGSREAKYFCSAWLVLLATAFFLALQGNTSFGPAVPSGMLIIISLITQLMLTVYVFYTQHSKALVAAKQSRDLAIENEQKAKKAHQEVLDAQQSEQLDLSYSIEERNLELEIALRELSEKNAELEKLSAIDPLTNLMNRRFFDKRMVAESRRSKREMTILGIAMLDIDHFKHINDTYGHPCGDYCLKVFAEVLKQTVKRPSDVICRYGGEEFVLILPNTDDSGLEQLLEKVRSTLEAKQIHFEGHSFSMTVSIGGCAQIISKENEHESILAFADKQLYRAKESGRNQVAIGQYTP